jgi:capsular polysaccharide transport system permease protein
MWLHLMSAPVDMSYFYLGWFFEIWVAVAICFIFTGLGLMSALVRRLFIPFAFIMMPFYGIFTMAYTMSPSLRTFFLYSPPFNATEMIRRGYIGLAVPTYFDIGYTAWACLLLTFVGLAIMQHARRNYVA